MNGLYRHRMSKSVWLVRHGQASFGKSEYDRLSDLGHEQARHLGAWLRGREWQPTRIVCGGLRRHAETVAELSAAAGLDLEPQIDARWNEIDHAAVLAGFKPAYKNMLLLKADMVRTLRPRAAFMDMFESASLRWASGEHDGDYDETYTQFLARTQGALDQVIADEHERILVVTSIGVIASLATRLSGGNDDVMRTFTLAGNNTGITRLKVDKSAPSLVSFNEIGHLPATRLVTTH